MHVFPLKRARRFAVCFRIGVEVAVVLVSPRGNHEAVRDVVPGLRGIVSGPYAGFGPPFLLPWPLRLLF